MAPDAKKVYLPARKHPYKGRLGGYTLATSCQRKSSEEWGMRFVTLWKPMSRKELERY